VRRKGSDWILEESWRLIAHRAMLRRTDRLCQMGGRHLHHQIGASLCKDKVDQTAQVGCAIESKLVGGNAQEAFHHLKGWYQAVSEMQAKPCYHTMKRQTSEQVDLYTRRASPGNPLPINYGPIKINNDAPSDKEIWLATSELSNGRAAGASRMRAKHVKDWLRGIRWEEDAKDQGAPGDGDNWQLFAHLVQATWTYGIIPRQILWIIVVLIPKGDRDYHGIGLLEPIWKVIKQIIGCRLNSIQLHDSLTDAAINAGQGPQSSRQSWCSSFHTWSCSPFTGYYSTSGRPLTRWIGSNAL
jgi:hypothetical protein